MKYSLNTLFFAMTIISILLAVNLYFARRGVVYENGMMYDYSHGWPAAFQSGPAPRPPSVWPDGTVFHHASGFNSFRFAARWHNLLFAVIVVVISCLVFNWIQFYRRDAK